jgi:hypothetical protein
MGMQGHSRIEKRVDWAFLNGGETMIPRVFHAWFEKETGGKSIEKGQRRDIQLGYDGALFPATIASVDRVGYSQGYKLMTRGGGFHDELRGTLPRLYAILRILRAGKQAQAPSRNAPISPPASETTWLSFSRARAPRCFNVRLVDPVPIVLRFPGTNISNDTAGRRIGDAVFWGAFADRLLCNNYGLESDWRDAQVREAKSAFGSLVLANHGETCAQCDQIIHGSALVHHLDGNAVRENALNPGRARVFCGSACRRLYLKGPRGARTLYWAVQDF